MPGAHGVVVEFEHDEALVRSRVEEARDARQLLGGRGVDESHLIERGAPGRHPIAAIGLGSLPFAARGHVEDRHAATATGLGSESVSAMPSNRCRRVAPP